MLARGVLRSYASPSPIDRLGPDGPAAVEVFARIAVRRILSFAALRRAFQLTLALAPCAGAGALAQQAAAATAAGSVSGTVLDSVSGIGLSEAMVQLVSRRRPMVAYGATTDAAGRFRIEGVEPDEYLAGFFHPTLDSLGIAVSPIALAVVTAGAPTDVRLAVPSAPSLARAHCGGRAPRDSTGVLLGYVVDADSGRAVPGARVVVSWIEITIGKGGIQQGPRRSSVTTQEGGFYVLCHLPADVEVVADAAIGRRRSGEVELKVPVRGLLRRDLIIAEPALVTVADSAGNQPSAARVAGLRGRAQAVGRVVDLRGRGVAGAQVALWGTSAVTRTRQDGGFTLDSLPAGTHTLEVRALGFSPTRKPVDLRNGRSTNASVMLEEQAHVLASVTVYGKRRREWSDIQGFLERSAAGRGGYFLTGADIDRHRPLRVSDVLRTIPGIRITPAEHYGNRVLMRGDCVPAVYIDGTRLMDNDIDGMLDGRQLGGVEVYRGVGETPVEYSALNGGSCGAILLWSKR
jgi:hypothetical protein